MTKFDPGNRVRITHFGPTPIRDTTGTVVHHRTDDDGFYIRVNLDKPHPGLGHLYVPCTDSELELILTGTTSHAKWSQE